MDNKELARQLKKKYGSQRKAADILGMSEMRRIIQQKNMIIRSLEMVNRNLQNELTKKKLREIN